MTVYFLIRIYFFAYLLHVFYFVFAINFHQY